MRNILRNMMRLQAERAGMKPSKGINGLWNRYQTAKQGLHVRERNIYRGTHKKSTWKMRCSLITD